MKIAKAIQILTICSQGEPYAPGCDAIAAIQLGIEALRRIKECCIWDEEAPREPLPGETED